MAFVAEKNVAIVWFAKSLLQLAFTVDDGIDENQTLSHINKSLEQTFPIKMEQFQPLNEKQHFTIHLVQTKNYFNDAFLQIESISHPGYYLDATECTKDDKSTINIFLSHKNQNKKKWQFINGQLRCNNGQSVIIFDISNTYSLKTISINSFNKNNIINNNLISNQETISTTNTTLYEESIFHLCFYDGNSIPEQVPILFYSPLYQKVITLIKSSDLNSGGHWLRLEKYDSHMTSQVWIFNLTHQNDIRSSVEKEQVFDYYNDGHRYLLYTHLHHGRPNQQWSYTNYKLITHEADQLVVEYDKDLQELKMREDVEMKSNQNQNENEEEENLKQTDSFDLSQCDIFGCSNVFLIFLSNQSSLYNYSTDLDYPYLYNPLINRHFDENSWISFDKFRGSIFDDYQNTSDYEKDYSIVTFKDDPNKTITFRNIKARPYNRYSYLNENSNYDHRKIKNWKDFNCFLNNKISISSDQRIFIHDVQLSENSSVTISLIMKGKLLSDYKKKESLQLIKNNRRYYYDYDSYEDSFDVDSDEENKHPVYENENEKGNERFRFSQHRLKPQNNEIDWQPKKTVFPELMNDLQVPENAQNNQIHVNNNFLPFLPFGRIGPRRFVPNRVNVNNNNNNNNNDEDPNFEIKYFDEKDIHFSIDDQFHQLLNGSSITITKENSEQCRLLGNELGITGLVEVANFVDSFSHQFAHLSDLSEIQRELMEINDSNYESLFIDFSTHIQNYDYLSIVWIILSVSIMKPLENDSLAKFCNLLLQNQPDEFKEEFKKSIIRDFKSFNTNLFFYRKIYLYCENLFTQDEMRDLLKLRKGRKEELIFFFNEFPEFQNESDQIKQSELNMYVNTGFDSNLLLKIIRDDDVDEFQKIFITKQMDPNSHIQTLINLPGRIPLLNNSPTLIQYAAFFGSVKIFKFLLLQNANLSSCDKCKRNTFTFALAGGNTEIIHIIQQELIKSKDFDVTTDMLRNAIKYGQNDVFKWIFTNSPKEIINKISKRDLILEAIFSKNINALLDLIEFIHSCESICVHFSTIFDNIEFLKLLYPFYFDNKFSLVCDSAISGNVDIMKFLLENNEGKFNNKLNLDKSLKKVAIRTAINNDNVETFKYLASEKDYSYSNFIYACKCNSLSLVKLFISNESNDLYDPMLNFSNILINGKPFLQELIEQKKPDVLDILLTSTQCNFDDSLFVSAVKNKLFDFAKNIYNMKKGFININEKGFLLQTNEPDIIHFLVSFPELDINMKDQHFKTAIENLLEKEEDQSSNKVQSISYLLDRSDIIFDFLQITKFAIKSNSPAIFQKAIFNILNRKSDDKDSTKMKQYKLCLSRIVKAKNVDLFITFIKSGLISVDEKKLNHYCIKLSSPKVYREICHDKLPKDKETMAIYYSIEKGDYECFSYLMKITSITFDRFNDFIPGSDQTVLTYAIKKAKDAQIVDCMISNKLVDINKPNKLGQTPFYLSLIRLNDVVLPKIIMHHGEIKFTQKEFELAIELKKNDVYEFIIKYLDRFVDDPQNIIQFLFANHSDSYIDILSTVYEEFLKNERFNLCSIIILYAVKYNAKSFIKNKNIVDEINLNIEDPNRKGATALCYAIYQRGIYLFDFLKYCHPLLLTNDFNINYAENENRITPFGNVRSFEDANNLINLLKEKKVPIKIMIKEVCGLNIEGNTAFYTSIVENNFILFQYLLKLNEEFNQKLKDNNECEEELINALIYTKNKDGNNPFYAFCLNKNWQMFINHLLDKMIQLNKKNHLYFGKYCPLSAAILSRNFKLLNILLSNDFSIDHYSFNQILKMNLYNSLGIRLLKSLSDFQYDLFMPLHLIKNDETINDLFSKKRINFNFHFRENSDEFIDNDYLLLSAIKNYDEKTVQLVLNNCDNNYNNILFDWKDSNGKTALHYAIENSMTNIVYILIDIFTKESKRFDYFFIEDKNSETPIDCLFKTLNEEYLFYFYEHALSLLKSCSNVERIKSILNTPTVRNKVQRFKSTNDESIFQDDDQYEEEEVCDFDSHKKDPNNKSNEDSDATYDLKKIKETLLTFAIRNNKVKFIEFILKNIPEIDPNACNSENETPLLISTSNPIIFEMLIDTCSQKASSTKSSRNDLDVNKNGVAISILENRDPQTASFCLNLLLQCQDFDINQRKNEIALIDLFIKKIKNFDYDIQKEFLCSPKIDFFSRPEIIFKLIDSDLKIPLNLVLRGINDDIIREARTDDDKKDTISTFTVKNHLFSNALNSLILDPRIDFVNSKNADGKSAIEILKERKQNDLIEIILTRKI